LALIKDKQGKPEEAGDLLEKAKTVNPIYINAFQQLKQVRTLS
jgi:hypothetical protein